MKLFNILFHLIIACLIFTVIHCEEPTSSADENPEEELAKSIQTALNNLKIDLNTQKVITKEQFRSVFKEVMGQNGDPETDKVVEKMANSFFVDVPEEIHLHNITDYFDTGKIFKAFTGILGDLGVSLDEINNAFGMANEQENNEDDFSKEIYDLIKNEVNDLKNTNDEQKDSTSNDDKKNEDL